MGRSRIDPLGQQAKVAAEPVTQKNNNEFIGLRDYRMISGTHSRDDEREFESLAKRNVKLPKDTEE